jgi:hypothetical protein
MSATKVNSIDIATVNNFKELLRTLHNLERQLPNSDLYKLTAFNSAYIVVTTAIEETSDKGYFENPKFIEKFTLSFSYYYFQIINDALASNDNMPVAWANLLTKKTGKQLPNFIYLLMGANAHINHDLSLVMVKMLDNDDTENLLKDVIKVDKLLVDCGDNILRTFTETKKVTRFIKDRTSYIYLPIIMHVILYWRVKAWKDYLSIKNNGLKPDRARLKGRATSNRLLRLGKLLSR